MDIVVSEKQIINFLRRRISYEDLLWIVNDVQEMIDEGESVDTAVYDGIRDFIKSKKFTEIDEFGDDQSYWDSYLAFERPLVSYVKMKLGLEQTPILKKEFLENSYLCIMETKGYVDSLVKKFYGKSYDEEHEVIQSIMNKLIREDMGGDTGIHIPNTIYKD